MYRKAFSSLPRGDTLTQETPLQPVHININCLTYLNITNCMIIYKHKKKNKKQKLTKKETKEYNKNTNNNNGQPEYTSEKNNNSA